MAAVQVAMIAGLPCTALRDAVLTHQPGGGPDIAILVRAGSVPCGWGEGNGKSGRLGWA